MSDTTGTNIFTRKRDRRAGCNPERISSARARPDPQQSPVERTAAYTRPITVLFLFGRVESPIDSPLIRYSRSSVVEHSASYAKERFAGYRLEKYHSEYVRWNLRNKLIYGSSSRLFARMWDIQQRVEKKRNLWSCGLIRMFVVAESTIGWLGNRTW